MRVRVVTLQRISHRVLNSFICAHLQNFYLKSSHDISISYFSVIKHSWNELSGYTSNLHSGIYYWKLSSIPIQSVHTLAWVHSLFPLMLVPLTALLKAPSLTCHVGENTGWLTGWLSVPVACHCQLESKASARFCNNGSPTFALH